MIGIKGMELPKSCAKCRFKDSLHGIYYCLFNCEAITDYGWQKQRAYFCPLVDLGKEDMSWEELKEKVKKLIPKIEIWGKSNEYFDIRIGGLCFWQDGEILNDENTILTDKTPYQMYQIIKALTGETE